MISLSHVEPFIGDEAACAMSGRIRISCGNLTQGNLRAYCSRLKNFAIRLISYFVVVLRRTPRRPEHGETL